MKSLIYIILLALLTVWGCQSTEETPVHDHDHAEVPAAGNLERSGIQTGPIQYDWFERHIQANGSIELPPAGRLKMTQIHGGYIVSTDLLPGQQVRKGQALCTVRNPEFVQIQQDYLQAKARSSFLQKDFIRKDTLRQQQGVSQQAFEQAQSLYLENQAAQAALSKQLELIGLHPDVVRPEEIRSEIVIRAPFTGYITNVHINPGQYVGPTDILFEIIDIDHLHGHVQVFENDAAQLEKGQKVRIYSSYQPEEVCMGEIFLIDKSLSEESVMGVHVDLEEEHREHLNVGMYIQAEIIVQADSAWVVPLSALVRDASAKEGLMIRTDEGTFEWTEVHVKDRNEAMAAIEPFWEGPTPYIVTDKAYKAYAATQEEEEGMDMGHSH